MRPKFFAAAAILFATGSAHAMNLDQYLERVVQKHRGLEALRASKEAAEDTRLAGDMDLVPVFSLGASYLSDKSPLNQIGAAELKTTAYTAGLSKKFSTGTNVSLSASATGMEATGIGNPAYAGFSEVGIGSLGISVSQSLWKNAFGRAIRLRDQRLASQAAGEVGRYDLQSRQILTSAENLYWDYIYAQEELRIGRSSLERATRIMNWFKRRVSDGISDRADLLSAQSLVATRELQVATYENNLTGLQNQLRDFLELGPNEALPALEGDLRNARDIKALVGEGRIVQLSSWVASQEAKTAEFGAAETEDATRADLALSGSYKTNGFAVPGDAADASGKWGYTKMPTSQVALTWSYAFDMEPKTAVSRAARHRAAAAKLMAERASIEGATAWSEAQRKHGELTRRIGAASSVAKIQSERVQAQSNKLSRGRAITADVINAEQDAADSELRLAQLQTEQRKLESQSRLFVPVKE